jgi:hypothetical protein
MAAKDYATLSLHVDQDYEPEVTSVGLTTESGEQRIDLMNEGFGGFSPGGGACGIEVGFTIPKDGLSYPWQQKCANKEWVTMQIVVGDKQYAGLGKLISVGINQSVNAAAEGSATWDGELSPLQ